MGLRKNYYRKSLRSSLHTHLRQHGKQKLSPGPWPPVNFLMESRVVEEMVAELVSFFNMGL
jgi:hypothetical protein